LAEEEEPSAVEGKTKAGQDPRLRLRVEVDQRVAADEEIEIGDGRIANKIVTPHDDRPPDVGAKRVPITVLLEVGFPKRLRHRLALLRPKARVTGPRDGIVVDVGGVDLDSPQECLLPELLRPQHGERKGLFARRAARAPNANRIVVALGVQDRRNDVLIECVPRFRIAEERGDVDQDGVEQLSELVRVYLEVILVVSERTDVHLLHSPGDPAYHGGALVPGEVERAVGLQILEERIEVLFVRLFTQWSIVPPPV